MEKEDLMVHTIKNIMVQVSFLNPEELEEKRVQMESDLARYEALGITDGHAYFKKHGTKKALLQRMEALCKLVKVHNETRDKIDLESIKP